MNTLFVMLEQQQGSPYMTLIMLGLIIVVFYFFMIRPQMKRQKELRNFQQGLSKGDRVIVAGGVMGKVSEVKEDHVVVDVDDSTRLRVVKSTVLRDPSDLQQPK